MKTKKLVKARKAKKDIKRVFSAKRKKSLQVAALPWRLTDQGLQIMLVSSRDTRRWIIPKGWPMAKRANSVAAAIEAIEEAGLLGVISEKPFGSYSYGKRSLQDEQLVEVEVFSLHVVRQRDAWLEMKQRTTQWFSAKVAAELVSDDGLGELIAKFAAGFDD